MWADFLSHFQEGQDDAAYHESEVGGNVAEEISQPIPLQTASRPPEEEKKTTADNGDGGSGGTSKVIDHDDEEAESKKKQLEESKVKELEDNILVGKN